MSTVETRTKDESAPLSLRAIFRLWLPLALSFELMMLEGPAVQAAIGRLPDAGLNLAAWGLTLSLAWLMESPVIMLLSTSTALVRGERSYRALFRFMLTLLGACTLLTGLVAFTPLFGFLSAKLLGQPPDIVRAAQPAFQILLLWAMAIGWRRFYQGVLVGHGQTRPVTFGTAIRLLVAISTAYLLARGQTLPGVLVGACALMAAVAVEAAATTLFALPILRRDVLPASEEKDLSQREIWRFHAPLALTTLIMLLGQPMTAAALARLPNAVESLAAWPVVAMVLLVMRGWCFALQEITVSLSRDPRNIPSIDRAAVLIGVITSLTTAAFALTPLFTAYVGPRGIDVPEALWGDVRIGIAAGSILPFITALSSRTRGRLVAEGATRHVYHGMAAGIGAMGLILLTGVLLKAAPMWLASAAFTLGALTEYVYLSRSCCRVPVRN